MPVALTSSVHAATYYVRTDGNNANNGLTNATGGAWQTINYAASHVAAGDVVRVQAGTYVETAAPSVNGTLGNPVTLVADGVVTTCGMNFSSKSYIRVIGFTMDRSLGGCANSPIVAFSGTNTGLEFWNDDVGNLNGHGYLVDHAGNGAVCNACIWLGGSIHNIGNPGSATALRLTGNDDFVGYVNFAAICYIGVGPAGNRQRFVNDNFSGLIACGSTHPDNFYIAGNDTAGWSNALWEASFILGTPTSNNNKVYHAQNQQATPWTDDVLRLHVVYNEGSASSHSIYTDSGAGAIAQWRQYNNDYLFGDRAVSGSQYNGCGGGQTSGGAISAYVYNSIYDQCWAAGNTSGIDPLANNSGFFVGKDYNLAYDPAGTDTFSSNWTSQAHEQSNADPKLNNISGLDFTLQSNSWARGKGGPLTTASGSGSGTSLTVAANTGSFFIGDDSANLPQYGGQLVPGDFITVGVTPVQVASVSGDVLTLASPISWNNGDPVYFGTSSTIDIGAYPYKAGGYTLTASYSQSGGVATVVPSDTSLVRFVVCFQNGIPTTVVNTAPYSCPTGSGTFQAIVYPRYASQTLQVVATPNGVPPSVCDLNSDGQTNVSDVQLCVNQAIGVTSCTTGDINKDGVCNVIDVQRDVNAALGGACVTQ